jgi:hypothetical protein
MTCHQTGAQSYQHVIIEGSSSGVRSGVFEKVLQGLAADLCEHGGRIDDLSECFIDWRYFIVAKKKEGGTGLERQQRGKGTKKLMAISDSTGLPAVSIHIASTASPHIEVTALADEATLSECFVTDEARTTCSRRQGI